MKFSVITLFPEVIKAYAQESIIKRALASHKIRLEIINLRDFTATRHQQVDDYQFGGGGGMVLMIEPLVQAIESVKTPQAKVVLLSPQGKTWSQAKAKQWAQKEKHIILVAGHYEGFDERIYDFIDCEISVGDYVLTGGELPALAVLDSITRLIPGVISETSKMSESFETLLDFPVYTKPVSFRGKEVPAVLLSGHHAKIQAFREEQRLHKTLNKRPDLLKKTQLTTEQLTILKKIKKE